ncbi:MAG: hypothetical protein CGW95_05835 [Phenylobacterium zucineum]|nr:MAG: hypothetical protein CGW95_05835 [Phenylobacterium zucineum]
MKFVFAAFVSAFLFSCLAFHPVWADEESGDVKPNTTHLTNEQKAHFAKKAKEEQAKKKATAKIKLVNLNGASIAELKKLPGVGDKEALQIIGGRPYGSKAWLQTRGVIDPVIYQGIKSLVVAGVPSKEDAAKMPEVFGKRK